jgi:hypothetical protein
MKIGVKTVSDRFSAAAEEENRSDTGFPPVFQRDMEVRTTTGLERAKLPGPGCQKEPYSPGRLSPALFLTF